MNKSHILTAITSSILLLSGGAIAQNKNSKIIQHIENPEINEAVNNNEAKNALFIEGHSYHVNKNQPVPLFDKDTKIELLNTSEDLSLTLKSKYTETPLEYFNFKNLPGIDGQIHALFLRNDFSQANNRTFNIQGQNVDNLKIAIPEDFQRQSSKQCDIIFISYQLKHTESPTNIIRYSKFERVDDKDVLKLYNSKPEGCDFKKLDEKQSAFYSNSGYIINFGFNPKKMENKNILDFTLYASKAAKEHFLENVETVLIKNDLTGLNFLKPGEAKFKKSPISAYHGSYYSANVEINGNYIVGVGFGEGKNREWLFTTTNIK